MKAKLNTIKAALYNVFVMGNADNSQIVRVWAILAIPMLTLYFAVGHLPQ